MKKQIELEQARMENIHIQKIHENEAMDRHIEMRLKMAIKALRVDIEDLDKFSKSQDIDNQKLNLFQKLSRPPFYSQVTNPLLVNDSKDISQKDIEKEDSDVYNEEDFIWEQTQKKEV